MSKEAVLYEPIEGNRIHCFLCHHHCKIADSRYGLCRVRQNMGGVLRTHAYGRVIAANVDPIEKKPLYHFLPGTTSYSIATAGCNFRCGFCQNWQISQLGRNDRRELTGREATPVDIADEALKHGCRSISYTYTEPTIFFEYAWDIARQAKARRLHNVFVTNGYMTSQALDLIRPYLDACNVDLKAYDDRFYKKTCRGRLKPVLESIRHMKNSNLWVEITTLVIPGQNDSESQLRGIARFIADTDPRIPWHISRFHPDYEFADTAATPKKTLDKAYEIGRSEGLHYIYVGNVLGQKSDTLCHGCGHTLIRRSGFQVIGMDISDGACPQCGEKAAGVFA